MGWLIRLHRLYQTYPRQFWMLIAATFIDTVGGALLFPFFTLYLTARFGIGMTTVGLIFGLFSISAIAGTFMGGALSDRWGRKRMLIFGLVSSALVTLLMGFAPDVRLFFLAAILAGLFGNVNDPARQAMVADLLPLELRADGYGLMRVFMNLAASLGPAIGGFMAARSYLALFLTDFIASSITAALVALFIRETLPVRDEETPEESMSETFGGYGVVLRDKVFMVFLAAAMFVAVVYMQMNTTLAVYLRDVRHVSPQYYGYLISMNALLVVIFQFGITRKAKRFHPLYVLALGAFLYAIGFGMYGVVRGYAFFVLAMLIITLGEMLIVPIAQAVVALLAPEKMRGRYMAVYSFSWAIPATIGPLLAGMIMDYADPNWVWYAAFVMASLGGLLYLWLAARTRKIHAHSLTPEG